MASIRREMRKWAARLPFWEQAALDKISAGALLTDVDYDQFLQYLLEDEQLAEASEPRVELEFLKSVQDEGQASTKIVQLLSISNLQNVNALVDGQTLTFGRALTAIYGGNGSGKSGYARVLGCAGFSRGDREVLPDATKPSGTSTALTADIEVSDETGAKVINYQVGSHCPELSSSYVFDSTSVIVHLTKSNALSFSPAGLGVLTQLADVTDRCRVRLDARINDFSKPHEFGILFRGDTEITALIAELGPETNLEILRKYAELTLDDQKRLIELDVAISRLKSEDIPKEIETLEQTIGDLNKLIVTTHD